MGYSYWLPEPYGVEYQCQPSTISKRPWPFLHIKEIEMDLGGIKPNVLSKLLRRGEKLTSFAFTSTFDTTFDFSRLHRELLRCCRGSLKKLNLHEACSCENEQRRRHYPCRLKHSLSFWGILSSLINLKTESIRSSSAR